MLSLVSHPSPACSTLTLVCFVLSRFAAPLSLAHGTKASAEVPGRAKLRPPCLTHRRWPRLLSSLMMLSVLPVGGRTARTRFLWVPLCRLKTGNVIFDFAQLFIAESKKHQDDSEYAVSPHLRWPLVRLVCSSETPSRLQGRQHCSCKAGKLETISSKLAVGQY